MHCLNIVRVVDSPNSSHAFQLDVCDSKHKVAVWQDQFSADDDAPLGKSDFLADLHHPVAARALDGGTDELRADVAFAEIFLVYRNVGYGRPLLDQAVADHPEAVSAKSPLGEDAGPPCGAA